MRTYPGLRFVIFIVVGLCTAIAIRAFAANKHRDSGAFRLEVRHRVTLKCKEPCEEKIKAYLQNSPSYDVCVRETSNGKDHHWNDHQDNLSPCVETDRPGSPHVQQTATFNSLKDLQTVVDALTNNASGSQPAPTPSPGKPTSSPAPQVQQHVESTTPQAAKAISVALSR